MQTPDNSQADIARDCPNSASPQKRAATIKRCTWLGFYVNGILAILKIVAGLVGHSGAMIADGIHSVSDFVTDVIVIIFVGVSAKGINRTYRYGHGKFETFATFLISVALLVVAIGLFVSGGSKVWAALHGQELEAPGYVALVMAVVSIVVKEWLFRYTKHVGDALKSMALVANAWHHRSDALSSIATLIGIGGAIFLGARWRILDPLAAMTVSVFIALVAYRLAKPAIQELLEVALPEDEQQQIAQTIGATEGILAFHNLRTRHNGGTHVVDVDIKVDGTLTVTQAHNIATHMEQRLRNKLGDVLVVTHIEPYMGQPTDNNHQCPD